ncbi:MAG: DUF1295 domain-containing protein [Ardenticatenales bacterium]|nr:DUF1295 domain-containing protein [Ardenticatenales bacterium]
MELYGQKSRSILQKAIIILLETVILAASWHLLFGDGLSRMGVDLQPGDPTRRILVFSFNCVVYVRMWITMTFLLKRRIPFAEVVSIPLAFALYYIGYSLLVYQTSRPIDGIDMIGVSIFVLGSLLNTVSEMQRDGWKRDPANQGRLYTEGLFGYSMHINYFGDWLWVIGYAVITRNWYSIAIPIVLFGFFVFFNIPQLDSYLSARYGEQFDRYRENTRRFIPFVL